ncbi:hypothetical protein PAXINDRAFT_155835 [Paxillus involutus ATCC 200175]|uniref:G domain-containing protein n=1 Tax=Paxillus involutus ATCC 200175 TaxID=664439 RepID=A0A0C9TXF0_PAXIN|nr:hypothetical protein PAXINDRAFT_155835 [Paxillus involutus ATCC 200175]
MTVFFQGKVDITYPDSPGTGKRCQREDQKGNVSLQQNDVIVAGQTGVGKSSLINMIMGVEDGSFHCAKVSTDVRPCTEKTAIYTTMLEGNSLQCHLWDTRGFDEVLDGATFMEKAVSWLRGSQCDRELKNVCGARTGKLDGGHAVTLLIWCISASKITVPVHWQQFYKAYVNFCRRKVKPVVVITQMNPKAEIASNWKEICEKQLLGLGITGDLLVRVRIHRGPSSTEYKEDSQAVRGLISRAARSP